jgi:large subunit ribosomal protein L10
VSGFEDLLEGPSAIAFIKGDPVEAAKGLRDFARTHPLLVIKGGVLDGNPLSPEEIRKLADLESREVLLAKMAGALQASLQNAVSLFAAPLAQTARVLEALRAKAEQDPSVLAGGAGTPAAPADATPDTTAEAPGEPAAQSAEAPASESAEAPASGSAEAPASESAEAPASESAEAPASESAEAPASESTEA